MQKIVLASMFYPLYALAVQLSPDQVLSEFQASLDTLLLSSRVPLVYSSWKRTHSSFTATKPSRG